MEAYGSLWLFGDNKDFFGGNVFSQATLATLQAHVEYAFPSGVWVAVSTRQSFGGETSLNSVRQDDPESNNRVGVSLNIPISEHNQLRFAFTTGLSTAAGNDYNSLYAAWTYAWIL